jgi:ribosomal protein L7/L12
MTTVLLAAFLGYVFGFAVSGWLTSGRDQTVRLNALERKVNLLLDHFEIDHDTAQVDIDHMIVSGLKINAIKLYREQTGLGLKESKDAIEERERYLRSRPVK